MNWSEFVGKYVKLDLTTGHYYKGKVIKADDESLTLEDFNGNIVKFSNNSIFFIREVRDEKYK